MTTRKTDAELVKGVLHRDESCFEELLNRYGSKVLNLAMRITRSPEDAEEILQDVFITIFTKLESFEHKAQFSSWLYRVTMNSSFMKIRARTRRRTVSIEDVEPNIRHNWVGNRSESFDVDTMSSRHELREAIQNAIANLPEEYRAIFVLRDIDGLSNESVSQVLQLSVPAVKSRLHRSRILMREQLKTHYQAIRNEEHLTNEPVHVV
ncbi:MAG: RNA polymerase sigma factor [Pseudomonadota bacterium]|jgi:RNA polymerase sigma-70 factor (ECF subfamily)